MYLACMEIITNKTKIIWRVTHRRRKMLRRNKRGYTLSKSTFNWYGVYCKITGWKNSIYFKLIIILIGAILSNTLARNNCVYRIQVGKSSKYYQELDLLHFQTKFKYWKHSFDNRKNTGMSFTIRHLCISSAFIQVLAEEPSTLFQ